MTTSFKQLEADFQRNLNEYKSTYQDYMVELNNQSGTYWNTEENVTVSNRVDSAQIPFLTEPDISKEKCLHSCASDPRCKYVLFSDSGNGECAANQCLKWTKDAGSIIAATSKPEFHDIYVGNSNSPTKTVTLPASGMTVYPTAINPQDPSWSDRFSVSVDGDQLTVTRTDQKSGWGQQLQLQGIEDSSGFKDYTLNVGSSSSNPKVIKLPKRGMVVDSDAINPQNPNWSDKFKTSIDGKKLTVTRSDQDSGWGQNLQLRGAKGSGKGFLMENKACAPGRGPAKTKYVYSGWSKPTWKDSNNMSFMGNPNTVDTTQWKELGHASSLAACKDMSITSPKGPFGSVVFVASDSKCYGGVPNATQENLKMDGVYSSIPPMGSTNLGGTSGIQYVEKLQKLNDSLKDNLYEMRSKLSTMESRSREEKEILKRTHHNIHSDIKKLNRDRVKLDTMKDTLNNLDVKLGILEQVTTREKMLYMGSALLFLALFAFILRKSS